MKIAACLLATIVAILSGCSSPEQRHDVRVDRRHDHVENTVDRVDARHDHRDNRQDKRYDRRGDRRDRVDARY